MTTAKTARERRALPRYTAIYAATAVGIAAFLAVLLFRSTYAVGAGATALFVTYLGFTIYELPCLTPQFLKKRAADADSPVLVIFSMVILLLVVAFVGLFLALNQAPRDVIGIWLSVASVLLGWFTINCMAGLHYAYEYYDVPGESPGKGKVVGGLDFPQGDAPDGWAFLYFAFVVGMTAQVSDVEVTSNAMRRLVLLHGVFSFLFNTVIVAATVNAVVALAGN